MNMTPEEERDALIDRYVNHKLTTEEEAEFEIRMMDDPELFEDVQVVEALKRGLRSHSDSISTSIGIRPEQQAIVEAPAETTKILSFKIWLRQPLSMAASVLVAALGLQAAYTGILTQPEGDALAIGSVVLLETSRGSSEIQFSGPPPYLFQIDVGLDNRDSTFNVVVRNTSTGETLLQESNLYADADGWVRIAVLRNLQSELTVDVTSQSSVNRLTRSYQLLLNSME